MGFFGAAYECEYVCEGGMGQKGPPLTSYIDETWHSYTLPKEDPKNT